MTTNQQTPRSGPYSGDGSTVAFTYAFLIDDEEEIVVIVADTDGVETTKALTTDYTVSGVGSPSGGTVTFTSAPASTETVVIRRATPQEQRVDLQNRKAVAPQTLEDMADALTRMVQDAQERLDRTLTLALSRDTYDIDVPAPLPNKVLGWNAAGDNLANLTTLGASVEVSPFVETLLDDATAADARATLGLSVVDGLTATTAELNKLDGVTVSTDEINHLDGVTSDIQTQLDGKISGVTAGTGLSGGGTSGGVALNGVTQSTAAWEAGTSTTEGVVSPAKAAASAAENSPVKAWVNFNGQGTVSIRDSFNVLGITDNGVGDYTVNFDTSLASGDYCVFGSSQNRNTNEKSFVTPKDTAAGSVHLDISRVTDGAAVDRDIVTAGVIQ